MARIALVQPNKTSTDYAGDLGLGYIRQHLSAQGHTTEMFDEARKPDKSLLEEAILGFRPSHVLIKVWGYDYESPAKVADAIRKRSDARIIIGGATATTRTRRSMIIIPADIAVVGDGIPTIDYAMAGELGHKGIAYRNGGQIIEQGAARFDLDRWPTPDISHINIGKTAPLVSQVGCRYACCDFCKLHELFRHVAYRTIGKVMTDMQKIMSRYNVSEFYFFDDNFLNTPSRAREMAHAMDAKGFTPDKKISFASRPDDVLRARNEIGYAKARIARIDMGIESFVQSMLNKEVKGTTVQQNIDAVDFVISQGIDPVMYMISCRRDTALEEIRAALDFFSEYPGYLLIAKGMGKHIDPENPTNEYPAHLQLYSFAMYHLCGIANSGVFKRARDTFKEHGTPRRFGSVAQKSRLKGHFDRIFACVEAVAKDPELFSQKYQDAWTEADAAIEALGVQKSI